MKLPLFFFTVLLAINQLLPVGRSGNESNSVSPAITYEATQETLQEDEEDTRPPRVAPTEIVISDEPVVWPMRLAERRPVPVVEAMLNGEGPFLFYLDTGAATPTLDRAFVERMELPIVGKTEIRGPGTGPGREADLVNIERLQIGDVEIRDFEAASFDRSPFSGGEEVAGSIGLTVFGDNSVTMDYSNDEVVIGDERLTEIDGQSVLACDFEGPVPFFRVQLGEIEIDAAFDSGMSGFLLVGEETASRLSFSADPTVVGVGRSISGEIEIKAAPLEGDLSVGNQVTRTPMVTIMPTILTDREIIVLGHSWIQELRVTYDIENGAVAFRSAE